MGVAGGLGLTLGGYFWALSALVSIPGLYTLASAGRPYTAPCPGCATPIGDRWLHLPDEPVMANDALNMRCAACGIYVDSFGGVVREVPFNRALDEPGYTFSIPAEHFSAMCWGNRCVRCGEAATRTLSLARAATGELTGSEATFADGVATGGVPFCAHHGHGDVVVSRASGVVDVSVALYAIYRSLLDENRACVDVTVRSFT